MDPYHVFIALDLEKVLDKLLIDIAVSVPHVSISLINVIFIHSFEVVEQWPHKLFVEENIFLNVFSFQPNWNAVLRLEQLIDLLLFIFVLRDNSWPPDPLEAHQALFLKSKNSGVKEAPRFFECE